MTNDSQSLVLRGARVIDPAQSIDRIDDIFVADGRISEIAQSFHAMEQCVVLGRGFNYATAYEWSLKLKELT